MKKITEITRRAVFDIIQKGFDVEEETQRYDGFLDTYLPAYETVHVFMPYHGRYLPIDFLDRVYHLEELPSTDRRYYNAKEDIKCHTVSFHDWPEFWFLDDDRFQLKDGFDDAPLLNFLCEMLHPAVYEEDAPWHDYLDKFNELLKRDGYELYSAFKMSGKDIIKSRVYIESNSPESLFSERYKGAIHFDDEQPIDNISGMVTEQSKKRLFRVMDRYREPIAVQRSKYSNWIDNTDALEEALNLFYEHMKLLPFESCYEASSEETFSAYFTPFVFDIIQLQYKELSSNEKDSYRAEINDCFKRDDIPFSLTDRGLIELSETTEIISANITKSVEAVSEQGLKELLQEAIGKHRQPSEQMHRDSVEKIWDALERLKTYYTELDKKSSVQKIVTDIGGRQQEFVDLFNKEFIELTDIGNKFRIRHHETDKIDITDLRHYDYFFNRCLSLVATAIQYLQ